jgi:hypothetical protein
MSAGARYCPNCGKAVGFDARFCTTCGATLTAQQSPTVSSYPSYQPPYQPVPHRSNAGLIIAVIVIVVLVVAVAGAIFAATFFTPFSTTRSQYSGNIVNGLITVPAAGYEYYPFTVPSGVLSIFVSGMFTASGGGGNNIEVFVADQTNFVNWKNGNSATSYYDSGQVTTGSISANLPVPGTYYLVYSNTFSAFSSKNVQTTANLHYTS